MKLNNLPAYKKDRTRIGRGRSAGKGKTCGRGHKGQKSRSGKKLRAGFEGGQTPLFQRLPKYRGFTNPNHINYQAINVGQLENIGEKEVNKEILLKHRLIRKLSTPVKILGKGVLSKAVKVTAELASQSAIAQIDKAGGSFTSTIKKKAEKPAKDVSAKVEQSEAKKEEKAEKEPEEAQESEESK